MRALLRSIYGLLHEESSRHSRALSIVLSSLIVANALAAAAETIPSLPTWTTSVLRAFEILSLVVFTAEYVCRVACCTHGPTPRHPVWGRLRYMITPLAIIDLVVLVPFYCGLPIDVRTLRVLRLLRLLRLVRYEPYARSLAGFRAVLIERRGEIMLCGMLSFGMLLVTATAMYYAERDVQPKTMGSIPDCMWWAVIHLTTIGYGDVYPVTQVGKIIAGVTALLGIGLVTLPSSIFAMAYVDHIRAERQKLHADTRHADQTHNDPPPYGSREPAS